MEKGKNDAGQASGIMERWHTEFAGGDCARLDDKSIKLTNGSKVGGKDSRLTEMGKRSRRENKLNGI